MTPQEYRQILQSLGRRQKQVTELLGYQPLASHRWAAGTTAIPVPVALLLRAMQGGMISWDDVEALRRLYETAG